MCREAGLGANHSCMAETQGELRVNAAGWSTAIIRLLHSVDPVFIFSFIFSFSHSISWRVTQFSLDSRERESELSPDCCTYLLPKSLVYYNIRRGKTWRTLT
jgi:hypothetical protein